MTLDHVGIAVASINEALGLYRDRLGLKLVHREKVPLQGVEVAFLGEGNASIELISPLGEQGSVAKFLKKRGPGLHHVAFKTKDIRGRIEKLTKEGTKITGEGPRAGARGHLVCFLHPHSCGGTLVELVEHGRI